MSLQTGDRAPEIKTGSFQLSKLKGKTVVLFSVPGAFTPTCDAKHLPGFVELADQIKAKGVEFTREPTTIRPGVRICFIRGPQGISIELLERDKKYA